MFFLNCWPLEWAPPILLCLILSAVHRDQCSLIFRSSLKGKPLKLSLTLLICLLYEKWQSSLCLFLFGFFWLTLKFSFFHIQSTCHLALSVYFCFSSFSFLCGNSCERWVLCEALIYIVKLNYKVLRSVICLLIHTYMVCS